MFKAASTMFRIGNVIATIYRLLKWSRAKAMLLGLLTWITAAVVLWYLLPYQPRFTLPETEDSLVLGFSPDGKILATRRHVPSDKAVLRGEDNGPVRLWDMETGKEIGSISTKGGFAHYVEFTPDSMTVLMARMPPGGGRSSLSVIDRISGQELFEITLVDSQAHFTPDGKSLYCSSSDPPRETKIWDISSARERSTLDSWPACFTPDSKAFATIDSENENEIRLIDSATGVSIRTIKLREARRALTFTNDSPIRFSPDGSRLTCEDNPGVKVWDPATGQELAYLEKASKPKFSRDSKRMAAWCKAEEGVILKLWDTSSWTQLTQIQTAFVPGALKLPDILAGPGPDEIRVATVKNRVVEFGNVERILRWAQFELLDELKVYEMASGKELVDFSTEGLVKVVPDGKSFVVSFVLLSRSKKSMAVFDIPLRRPIGQILLWPLVFALAAILVFWLLFRGGSAKRVELYDAIR